MTYVFFHILIGMYMFMGDTLNKAVLHIILTMLKLPVWNGILENLFTLKQDNGSTKNWPFCIFPSLLSSEICKNVSFQKDVSDKGKLAKGSSSPCDKPLPVFSNEPLISITKVGFIWHLLCILFFLHVNY